MGISRATATVLFTDLVGSTELRTRLGEEAADELRRVHDRLLADAVEAHAGRVVKGLGDGIMAVFAAASDAVAAGVAIQQAVDRQNRRPDNGAPLSVRVGISLGDVTFEDDDVHGTPVVEAARLCAAATGGQILASDLVRVLVGAGHVGGFATVGPLDLKGLAEPLLTCAVVWEPRRLSPVPLPAFLTDLGRIFVGRGDQLDRLGQLWKEATAGERRVAFLAGEPGVGKTRLAAELAIGVHEDGATVLLGRCDEDLGVPYQPFVEALRQFVDHTPTDELQPRLGRYAGELARLIPELPALLPALPPAVESDPETERYRLFDAVAAWLGAVSADDPLLLVLDDLQWASKPTLLLLRHVVNSTDPKRLLLLATYRDTELGHDHPLGEVLADLRRQRAVERLSLLGLDSSGVAAYMEQAAGRTLDDEDLALARAIHEETEGNLFFVREVLRHLTETGAVAQHAGRWGVRLAIEDLGIPEGVREVVGRRLSRLSPGVNRLLEVGAVAGLEFEMRVLQAVEGLGDDDLVAAFEEAARARLVTEVRGVDARYRFAHALVRDTLYSGLSTARRVTLHRRVAEAIETLHATALANHLPALAHHWAEAGAAAETARAVDYAARAGDQALAQLANDEAVRYYRQAIDLLDLVDGAADGDRRLELMIGLGDAQRRAGEPASRTTLLDAGHLARRLGRGEAMGRAALASSRGTFSELGVVDTERVLALEEALSVAGDADPARRARLLAILAVELLWSADPARCRHLSDEALSLAHQHGDPRVLGSVIALRWATIWHPRWAGERLQLARELLSLAEVTGDPSFRFWGLWRQSIALMELADGTAATESREAARRQADELGQPFLHWCVVMSLISAAVSVGRLDEAERIMQNEVPEFRIPDAGTLAAAGLAGIRYEQGRLIELEPLLQSSIERLPRVPLFPSLLALAYLECGRVDEARAIYGPLGQNPTELVFDYFAAPTAAVLAAVCSHLGDTDGAARLYDLLSPYAGQIACHPGIWFGSYEHHLGLLAGTLGRRPEADAHFARAAETHERLGASTWLARTQRERSRIH